MNDADRDLIQQVLKAAGKAGEQGFAYLVQYQVWDGVTSIVAWAFALAGVVYLLKRAFAWKPKEDEAHIARAAALALLCFAAFGCLCGIQQSTVQVLVPQGAAIHSVLHH